VVSVTSKNASLEQRLDGWKSIARHMSRSCRTVQRWHAEYGLPICRLGGEKSSVYAYCKDLDTWMMNRGLRLKGLLTEIAIPPQVESPLANKDSHHQAQPIDYLHLPESANSRSAGLAAHAFKFWPLLSTRNITEMAVLFRKAIELDLTNATAFAGLSLVLIVEGLWGLVRTPEATIAAQSALHWALEIDSELPAAKCAAAWLKMIVTRDWQGAGRDFDEILMRQPPPPLALIGRAVLQIAAGSPQRASGLLLKAAQAYPLSSNEVGWYCWSEYLAGEYANALHQIEEYRASGRSEPLTDAVEALVSIQLEESGAQIERLEMLTASSLRNDVLRGALGYSYAIAGQREKAIAILNAMTLPKANEKNHEPYAIALVLTGLNQRQQAVKWLERSYREGSLWSIGFLHDPILASMHNDLHYRMFLSEVICAVPSRSDSRLGFTG